MKARPLEGKGDEPMKKFILVITSITVTAAAVGQCWALGLGELRVYTYLNEPLIAQIDLLEADDLSEGEMQVGIATDAEFTRLGMIRDVFLTRINFVVELDAAGKRVVLSTDAPLREPYLDFVVDTLAGRSSVESTPCWSIYRADGPTSYPCRLSWGLTRR